MSYYQLISLKLQMGIDPDACIDLGTLLAMWKQHRMSEAVVARPTIVQTPHSKPETNVHSVPQGT